MAARHAGARRTARKKKSVQTGTAAARGESQAFPSGLKFCRQGSFIESILGLIKLGKKDGLAKAQSSQRKKAKKNAKKKVSLFPLFVFSACLCFFASLRLCETFLFDL